MNAHLFTGLVHVYRNGHFLDACSNVILYGADQDACRKAFEEELLSRKSGEEPVPTKIERIVAAPVQDQLFTETGCHPINWPEIAEEAVRILEATPPDDLEQGYWVDCDEQVRPDKLASNIESLQRELPDEIRSGLNWSSDKTCFFLISVLRPPGIPAEIVEDMELEMRPEEDELQDGVENDLGDSDLAQRLAAFPQLAEKELAVVVRARNSVVAAWLWRRYAASTPLAGNAIRIDALCDVAPVPENHA